MQPNFSFHFAITIAIILNFSENSSPMECVKVSKFDISPYFPLLVNICAKSKLYMCILCGKLCFSNFSFLFCQINFPPRMTHCPALYYTLQSKGSIINVIASS